MATEFVPVVKAKERAKGSDPVAPLGLGQGGQLVGESAPDRASHFSAHPRVPLADRLGEGLAEGGGAPDGPRQFEGPGRAGHEGIHPLLSRPLEDQAGEPTRDAVELEIGRFSDQGLHVVEVSEDRSPRDAGACSDFVCSGPEESVLETIEHRLGDRDAGSFGAGMSSVDCGQGALQFLSLGMTIPDLMLLACRLPFAGGAPGRKPGTTAYQGRSPGGVPLGALRFVDWRLD